MFGRGGFGSEAKGGMFVPR